MVTDDPSFDTMDQYVKLEQKYEQFFQELKTMSVEELLGLITLKNLSSSLPDWERSTLYAKVQNNYTFQAVKD